VPITPVAPPEPLTEKAANRVGSLAQIPGPHFLRQALPENLELVAPHRVYALPLSAVNEKTLSSAEFLGWRFLVVASYS
jgi:hypothetical protein